MAERVPRAKCHAGWRVVALTLLLQAHPGVPAADVVVVVSQHGHVDTLSRSEVADLFLGRARNPQHLVPLDQKDEALRERFYHEYADMSLGGVRAYWAKRVFTGRGRPPPMTSLADTPAALDTDHAVITYIPADMPIDLRLAKPIDMGGQDQ